MRGASERLVYLKCITIFLHSHWMLSKGENENKDECENFHLEYVINKKMNLLLVIANNGYGNERIVSTEVCDVFVLNGTTMLSYGGRLGMLLFIIYLY